MRIWGIVVGVAVALLAQGTPSASAAEKGKARKVQKSAGDKGGAASSKAGKSLKGNTTGGSATPDGADKTLSGE